MGKLLIFSELFQIRELMAEDLAGEGHTIVATGKAYLIQNLLTTLAPDMVLLDFHLNRTNPWRMIQLIKKNSPGISVVPFSAYTDTKGDLRVVVAQRDGGENISLQAFKQRMNMLLGPRIPSEREKSPGQRPYRSS